MTGSPGARGVEVMVLRWTAVQQCIVIGSLCTITGGLVAAITRPLEIEIGSWLAAYLVLVGGVAQIALGLGQTWIAAATPGPQLVRAELVTWNLGVATAIVGTLMAAPAVTTLGSVALAAALGLFLGGVRSTRPVPSWGVLLYRGVVAIIMVSVPVGVSLAWIRHG